MKRYIILIIVAIGSVVGLNAQTRADSVVYYNNKTGYSNNPYELNAQLMQQMQNVDWTRTASSLSLRLLLRVTVVNTLKHKVHEWRPDGSDDHSFPSRHAVWAYGMAGTIAYATGDVMPWGTVVSQTVANGVGMQRVMARRHWPGDVLAGAGMGVGLDMLTRGVVNLIFGTEHLYHGWNKCHNLLQRNITASTGAWIPMDNQFGEYTLGTAFTSGLRATFTTSEIFGLTGGVDMMSAPVKMGSDLVDPLTSLTFSAGPIIHGCIADGPVAVGASAQVGYRLNFKPRTVGVNRGTATAAAKLNLSVTLTPRLVLGVEGGYNVSKLQIYNEKRTLGAITVGVTSRANF